MRISLRYELTEVNSNYPIPMQIQYRDVQEFLCLDFLMNACGFSPCKYDVPQEPFPLKNLLFLSFCPPHEIAGGTVFHKISPPILKGPYHPTSRGT